jgi:putative ABC transport system permease protein
MGVVQGTFLAPGDVRRGAPIAVLGPVLKRELFGDRNAIGSFVRVAGRRLRVVGVMEPKGRILGFDLDDVAWVPVATAMSMFDLAGLNEIDVTFAHASLEEPVVEAVLDTLRERHGGDEDVTVLTQSGMLDVLDDILRVVTVGVVAIGAISLLVGAIGILSVLWIAVGERTGEIGLLRAIGASAGDVRRLFLLEAVALSLVGGSLGLAGGLGLARLLTLVAPGLPLHVSPMPAVAALAVSLATGLVSGLAPARRAAQLDPVEALRAE